MSKTNVLSFCLVVFLMSGCATSQREATSPLVLTVREANAFLDEGKTMEAMVLAAEVTR